jgi:hypothetical protein
VPCLYSETNLGEESVLKRCQRETLARSPPRVAPLWAIASSCICCGSLHREGRGGVCTYTNPSLRDMYVVYTLCVSCRKGG